MGSGSEEDTSSFAVQREAIEKQCNELDRLIRDFSSYLENAVGLVRFPDIVLQQSQHRSHNR